MEILRKYVNQLFLKKPKVSKIRNFRDFFQCEEIFLKFGVNFLNPSIISEASHKWQKIHFTALKIATFVIILLSVINFVISLLPNGSIVVAIESSAAVGIFVLMLLKIYTVMMRNRVTLMEILDKLDFHFPTDAWNQHVFMVENYLKTLRIFKKITLLIYTAISIQLISVPFCQLFYRWITSSPVEIDLIIKCYVPLDYSNPFVYAVVYIFHCWIFLLNVLALFSNELLYFGLMIILSMKFDILGQVMSEIDPREDKESAVNELKTLIKIHQELIEIAEKLQNIFSLILFVNIFGMIYLICGTAFLSIVSVIFNFMLFLTLFFCVFTTAVRHKSLLIA